MKIIDKMNTMVIKAQLLRKQKGAGLVEYALIVSLVSIAAIGALTALGTDINSSLQSVADKLTTAPAS